MYFIFAENWNDVDDSEIIAETNKAILFEVNSYNVLKKYASDQPWPVLTKVIFERWKTNSRFLLHIDKLSGEMALIILGVPYRKKGKEIQTDMGASYETSYDYMDRNHYLQVYRDVHKHRITPGDDIKFIRMVERTMNVKLFKPTYPYWTMDEEGMKWEDD